MSGGRIQGVKALLYDLDRVEHQALLTISDEAPQLVTTIDGGSYLLDRASLRNLPGGPLRFYEVKPYRIDAGLIGGGAS
jgi:hypothetical protein